MRPDCYDSAIMTGQRFLHAIFIPLFATFLSCAGRGNAPANSAVTDAVHTTPDNAASQIIYGSGTSATSQKISAAQSQELQELAHTSGPLGRPVWFVLITAVMHDKRNAENPFYEANVYYEPDRTWPGARSGKWARIVRYRDKARVRFINDYMQVAPSGKPFATAREIPPDGPYLPFDATGDEVVDRFTQRKLTRDQVVRLVQALYATYESDEAIERGQRVEFFSLEENQLGVNIGTSETTGQTVFFTQIADGSYRRSTDGTWVRP